MSRKPRDQITMGRPQPPTIEPPVRANEIHFGLMARIPQTASGLVVGLFCAVVLVPTLFDRKPFEVIEEWPRPFFYRFFLSHEPTTEDYSALPKTARDVFAAKVRIFAGPSLGTRNTDYRSANTFTTEYVPDRWQTAQIEIIGVIRGKTTVGAVESVRFAEDQDDRYIYPRSKAQKTAVYWVISYVNDRGWRQLLSVRTSVDEYLAWKAEPAK